MWTRLARWLPRWVRTRQYQQARCPVPDELWQGCLQALPFLGGLSAPETKRLAELTALFLEDKEFHGAQGLIVSDVMAVQIAAQACLPVLHLGIGAEPLRWYDDFVGIVIHADEVRARRTVEDEIGIVHEYDEVIAGEAMPGGPVMLSWQDVNASSSETGYNVVIHEFVHKLDLRDGQADGCPPLPLHFLGAASAREARELWTTTLQAAYETFREATIRAVRFGGKAPWLDAYAEEDHAEFYAVTSEAYFVNRTRFSEEFPTLVALYDAWYLAPQQG